MTLILPSGAENPERNDATPNSHHETTWRPRKRQLSGLPYLTINKGDHLELQSTQHLPFRLVKNLGGGASAVVEMVEDVMSGKMYARKVFRNVHSYNLKQVREQYFNEIKVIQRLAQHPHVINIHSSYKCGRDLALILDPVADGGDLAHFFQMIRDRDSKPTLRENQILLRAFGCLASGLEFMHQQTVRHKDIKPQNILLHQGLVIYTDFGISNESSLHGHSTTTGRPEAFSRRYCAPEVSDWAPRNSKADIFSLGCVFAEILQIVEPSLFNESALEGIFKDKIDMIRACLQPNIEETNPFYPLQPLVWLMLNSEPSGRPDAEYLTRSLQSKHKIFLCGGCMTQPTPKVQPKEPHLIRAGILGLTGPVFDANRDETTLDSGNGYIPEVPDNEPTNSGGVPTPNSRLNNLDTFRALAESKALAIALAEFKALVEAQDKTAATMRGAYTGGHESKWTGDSPTIINWQDLEEAQNTTATTSKGAYGAHSSLVLDSVWKNGKLSIINDRPAKIWSLEDAQSITESTRKSAYGGAEYHGVDSHFSVNGRFTKMASLPVAWSLGDAQEATVRTRMVGEYPVGSTYLKDIKAKAFKVDGLILGGVKLRRVGPEKHKRQKAR
jgi:serine/threonine protein kinase